MGKNKKRKPQKREGWKPPKNYWENLKKEVLRDRHELEEADKQAAKAISEAWNLLTK
ncbi:MAG: hypothetical protein PHD51_00840 [Patescibacteria group bacterium]|nr:hypothetical protein [Patescibacteria group bacterium]MDD5490590.1 hypothetical protein [Patescibacteria group bacterium]